MDIAVAPAWLEPTWFIDSDSPEVADFVRRATEDVGEDADDVEVAVALFEAVRDRIRYDPYVMSPDASGFRASAVAQSTANWCTPKAVLLTAAARHRSIPARLGFADVRNHLSSEKLSERMGTDLFIWHGYTEMLLEGEWRKASSAFNIELCERFGVMVLDFDGRSDALMHPFDEAGNRHMEYVNQRGSFDDLPLDAILADFRSVYLDWMDESIAASGAAESGDAAFAPDQEMA